MEDFRLTFCGSPPSESPRFSSPGLSQVFAPPGGDTLDLAPPGGDTLDLAPPGGDTLGYNCSYGGGDPVAPNNASQHAPGGAIESLPVPVTFPVALPVVFPVFSPFPLDEFRKGVSTCMFPSPIVSTI